MVAKSRRTKANPIPLRELLDDIDAGFITLPDFQRDFDWTERDVSELIVTVLSGWPAGSLLFVEGRPDFLPARAFRDGPPPGPELTHMVLDGQQRLTALFHAIRNRGDKVYWLDISNISDFTIDDLEERVLYADRDLWAREFQSAAQQYSAGRLPMYALATASDFFEWRDEVLESLTGNSASEARESLNQLYKSLLSNVATYEFPVVEVPSNVEAAAIARIFERVNKTGITLGPFDLMVARTFRSDWNLRNRWQIAASERILLERFLGDDGLPVLRAMALVTRHNVRRSALLGMPATEVHELWDQAIEATEAALGYLVRRCGVVDRDWLPYQAFLVVLTGLAFEFDLDQWDEVLQKWFWSVSLGAAYDVASNTRLVADYLGLRNEILGEGQFAAQPIDGASIIRATRSKRAIWRGFQCALAKNRAHDLLGGSLGFESLTENPEGSPPQPAWASVADRRSGFHLHALSQIACTRTTFRRLRKEGLIRLEISPDAAASQFIPEDPHVDDYEFMFARLHYLQAFAVQWGASEFEIDADLGRDAFTRE